MKPSSILTGIAVFGIGLLALRQFHGDRARGAGHSVAQSGAHVPVGEKRGAVHYGSASTEEPGFTSRYVATSVVGTNLEDGLFYLFQRETIPANASDSVVSFAPGTLAGNYTFKLPFRAGLSVTHVAARHGHEYLVVGHPRGVNGPVVVSETLYAWWRFDAPDGAPYITRDSSSDPIGTPTAHSAVRIELGGDADVYVEPDDRGDFKHSTEFIGRSIDRVRLLEVDPDGRYAFVVTNPDFESNEITQVLRINLRDFYSEDPCLVTSSESFPSIAEATMIKRGRRMAGGTKTYVLNCLDGNHVLFEDADNDGAFETIFTLSHSEYEAEALHVTEGWSDNYVNHSVEGLFLPE